MKRNTDDGMRWRLAAVVLVAGMCSVWAQGTTSPATGYAWSETVGWINFAPQHGGPTGTVPTLSEWGIIALALVLGFGACQRIAQARG